MNIESIVNIILGVMPNVKDMEFIQTYGLITWFAVFFAKIFGFLLILWFIIKVLRVKLSIGK